MVFLAKKLLKVTKSELDGLTYYSLQIWPRTPHQNINIKRWDSVHYKTLRLVENDWKRRRKKRAKLDKQRRAKPSLWGKYATRNFVM